MRRLTDKDLLTQFMRSLGRAARRPARVYFTGGCTAVLYGWRDNTIDIDVRLAPDHDELYRFLSDAKETLQVNIELASPPDFIPEVPGWEDRSKFIGREGKIDFYHFDPYSQALSKLRRKHDQDIRDVESMFNAGLISADKLVDLFQRIKPLLYKYPAIDQEDFERSVLETAECQKQKRGE
jgi:hypothetical protein